MSIDSVLEFLMLLFLGIVPGVGILLLLFRPWIERLYRRVDQKVWEEKNPHIIRLMRRLCSERERDTE